MTDTVDDFGFRRAIEIIYESLHGDAPVPRMASGRLAPVARQMIALQHPQLIAALIEAQSRSNTTAGGAHDAQPS